MFWLITRSDLTNVGGTLYFSANDGASGVELWKSDGTVDGTVLVKDIWFGSNPTSSFDGPLSDECGWHSLF